MCVSASGMTSVQSLEGSEAMLGMGPFEMAVALTTGSFGHLELAVECVDLGHDIEDLHVRLVIACQLGNQPPVVRAVSQLDGLVIGR